MTSPHSHIAPPAPRTLEDEPVPLSSTVQSHLSAHPLLMHSGVTAPNYFAMHVLGATFPVTAALMFYGWRSFLVILAVLGSAAAAVAVWRRIGKRGQRLRYSDALWYAL